MSELLKINVNDHIEKKNGLSYLSWAWAWAEVLRLDPSATWKAHEFTTAIGTMPCMFLPDESAMVKVSVTIKGNEKTCVLPVMDNRNKAIKAPDSFAVNTATMRCLAKAIGMHGLGLYIYAGEDLPEGDKKPEQPEPDAEGRALAKEYAESVVSLFKQEKYEDAYIEDDKARKAGNEFYLLYWGFLRGHSSVRSNLKEHRKETLKKAA